MVISRRKFLAASAAGLGAAACGKRAGGYRGYAFVANQDGQAIAAVDLQVLAVARLIPLDGSPSQVVASQTRPSVFALTPGTGSIHEIDFDRLNFKRKTAAASSAVSMLLNSDESALYMLARDPRALIRIAPDSLQVTERIPLPGDPVGFDVAVDGKMAAVNLGSTVHLVDLASKKLSAPLGEGDYSVVRFRKDGRSLIAADRAGQRLSVYDVASAQLVTHLPLAVRPENMCFKADGGEIFVTGPGLDGVVIMAPYQIPEVSETILAGSAPGPMGASADFLFVTSPQSGAVTIVAIRKRQVIGVVPVGSDPGFVAVTRDDQFALVLNRVSGDVAVLRVGKILPNRLKNAALLTVIPVGSRPVNADVKGV